MSVVLTHTDIGLANEISANEVSVSPWSMFMSAVFGSKPPSLLRYLDGVFT